MASRTKSELELAYATNLCILVFCQQDYQTYLSTSQDLTRPMVVRDKFGQLASVIVKPLKTKRNYSLEKMRKLTLDFITANPNERIDLIAYVHLATETVSVTKCNY